MRGLKKNNMRRGHVTEGRTSRLYESIGPEGRCFEKRLLKFKDFSGKPNFLEDNFVPHNIFSLSNFGLDLGVSFSIR